MIRKSLREKATDLGISGFDADGISNRATRRRDLKNAFREARQAFKRNLKAEGSKP